MRRDAALPSLGHAGVMRAKPSVLARAEREAKGRR